MAVDLYLYNGTTQVIDSCLTNDGAFARTGRSIPPGAQLHVALLHQGAANAITSVKALHGSVNFATLGSPTSLTGIAHHTAPVTLGGRIPPIV